MKRNNIHNKIGFTLVEILTTIAIIAILLGFLIPALRSVEKTAMKVKQRAQFHGIEVALEAFYTDMGDYPPSAYSLATYGDYSPSQRLAEALVGGDGFGFHPDSQFNELGQDSAGNDLYAPAVDPTTNIGVRKGPYLELETANAVKLSNLYYDSISYGALANTYVLADMYKITRNAATGKMTGSPILYYRANRNKTEHALPAGMNNNCTYNVYDSIGSDSVFNDSIPDLKPLSTKSGKHPLVDTGPGKPGLNLFYTQTTNPNFTSPPRPYRAESFILQSAGPDSLYGTSDDVFNFDQED